MNRFDCSIWLPSPNNERLSKWRFQSSLKTIFTTILLNYCTHFSWDSKEYGDLSYLYPCHPPFHMGRGGCGRWLPIDIWHTYHLDVLSVVLPIYILYLLPTIQLTLTLYIYLISGDQTKGRFCELRSGMVQPLTEVSMAYPKNESTLPETFRGEWVPIGFENQLSPL